MPVVRVSWFEGKDHDQKQKVAAEMGTPLIPMQRFVVRVLTELNNDGSYRYRTGIITVPRQCGKSVMVSAIATTRRRCASR